MSPQPSAPRPWVIATALTPLPTPGFFVALGQALVAQGTPVTFLSAPRPKTAVPDAETATPDIAVAAATGTAVAHWPSPRPTGIKDLVFAWRLLRRLRPAGLIANFGAVTPLLLAGWLARVPVRIAWYHTLSDYDAYDPRLTPRRLRWLNWRRRQVYRLATHVIAVSAAARQNAIQAFGIAPEKCLVIPNAMRDPLEEFPDLQNVNVGNPLFRKGGSQTLRQTFLHPLRIPQAAQGQQTTTGTVGSCLRNPQKQQKFWEGVLGSTLFQKGGPNIFPQKGVPNRFLLCVGTLHRAKGQDILVRAMARLKTALPELRCVFFGEGPAAAELRQLAAELEIADQCYFAGNRPRLEVLQAMQQAAVVVCPSRSEAFGYVVLEAMALGRPLVAAAAGGIPEIVRAGLDGKLFPAGDDQALAVALHHVLSNPQETAAWGRHGRECFLAQFELSQRLPGLIQPFEMLF